jgi:hypothetical protein
MDTKISAVSVIGQIGQAGMKLATLASGSQTASLMSKKDYGIAHGLKGAALDKAHFAYKKDAMSGNAKLIGAALLTGELGVTRLGVNKAGNGGSISFKAMDSLKAPKEKAPDLSKVNVSDIMAFLEGKGYEINVKS